MDAYYYRPIPHCSGRVLKCAGMVSEDNAQWFPEKCADAGNGKTADGYLPGFIVTDEYKGDRINADDLSVFEG